MITARKIARTLDLKMKVGEVEYQGDKRKATFYYTAEGRVDFRELVRMYAKEFRVKIEMKQIGSRQESSLIGGIGTCGRELCCSTWKSEFQSVNTTAARYQNLAINQTKLTGQCGRLKCCLNYELDSYMDALKDFPKNADSIKLENGYANLVKTDIFKGIMYYSIQKEGMRGPLLALSKDRVKKLLEMNKKGVAIKDINNFEAILNKPQEINEDNIELDFADVTGEIELPELKRKKRRNKKKRNFKGKKPRNQQGNSNRPKSKSGNKNADNKSGGNKQGGNKSDNAPSNPNQKRRPKPKNKKRNPDNRSNDQRKSNNQGNNSGNNNQNSNKPNPNKKKPKNKFRGNRNNPNKKDNNKKEE